ncbi:MAG TPA: DNA-processing protein DprA [Casimicrobiaceae bacterium]|nr:DNA-processing protein DprA [Casimicrobiaceae bacterium]
MIVDARVEAWTRLQLAGVAPRALVGLLRVFGDARGILAATSAQRRRHVEADVAARLDAAPDASRIEAALAWLSESGHELMAWDDPAYPRTLLEIADPPSVFYFQGRRELLAAQGLAIVGSRNATPQGCEDAEAFAAALSAAGFTIVSGLAQGIDAAAHRGGLRHAGSSIAVIGTGPDRIYPARNRDLAHELVARGLVISEFAPGTPPLRQNFPQRNRLVSGLSRGVLVVEATLDSGSLITARLAAEQGREVFALPGSIHSPFSKGGHRLIREGAKLVETAQDILEELSAGAAPAQRVVASAEREIADPDARAILRGLGHDPTDVDTLVARTGLTAPQVGAALTALELERTVACLPGGRWQRISPPK